MFASWRLPKHLQTQLQNEASSTVSENAVLLSIYDHNEFQRQPTQKYKCAPVHFCPQPRPAEQSYTIIDQRQDHSVSADQMPPNVHREEFDAHLTIVQFCQVCLIGFGLVGALTAVASQGPGQLQRHRLQCAVASAACFISTRFYRRLHILRRLPNMTGYSLEANTVAETMRHVNSAIVTTLLGFCALMLRGPFIEPAYGPFNLWSWSYTTWRFIGPFFSFASSFLSLPAWHASRVTRKRWLQIVESRRIRQAPEGDLRLTSWFILCPQQYTPVLGWLLTTIVFASTSILFGLTIASVIWQPIDKTQRTETEELLGRCISSLWFVYPCVSLLRTLGVMAGQEERSYLSVTSTCKGVYEPSLYDEIRNNSLWWAPFGTCFFAPRLCAVCDSLWWSVPFVCGILLQTARSFYLALVTAPSVENVATVAHLAAAVDGNHAASVAWKYSEAHVSQVKYPYGSNQGSDYGLHHEHLMLKHGDGGDSSSRGLVSFDRYQDFENRNSNFPHEAHIVYTQGEVAPLCSQAVDSLLAFIDIISQSITTLGVTFITLEVADRASNY